jgi:general secretion pathway protein D
MTVAGTTNGGRVVRRQLLSGAALVLALATLAGCAAGRAFSRGEDAARAGDWDTAVAHYRQALQTNPQSTQYRIALERAMLSASHVHLDQARIDEARGQLPEAIREYRKAAEYDPSNRQAAGKATELEQTLRDRAEAARPKAPVAQMREKARQAAEPFLNPASREALTINLTAPVRSILDVIAKNSGINIVYDKDVRTLVETVFPLDVDGVTLEQTLNLVMTGNGLFYKILNERTILIIPDNPPKRAAYEEQVIQTFYVSNAKVTELATTLNNLMRVPGVAVIPAIQANESSNSITVRGGAGVVAIIERVIDQLDKPRAEVVIDVEILEVNKDRIKQYGLDLGNYQISAAYQPGGTTSSTTSGTGSTGTTSTTTTTAAAGIAARTLAHASTADLYFGLPSAVVHFLETDSETKLVAKPQLRGQEGTKLTLKLGDDVPVPSTTFTPLAAGGSSFNPMTSYTYRTIGVNVEVTPRVTLEGDVILELTVESSSLGAFVNVAGQSLQSFGTRSVSTKLRLRDGESNLLAGLLREDTRRALSGFPGAIHLPVLKQLFSSNDNHITHTDIVMLLTPRIVRTNEITQRDLSPIFIGTQQALGLTGAPPLIAPPAGAGEAVAAGTQPPAGTTTGAPIVPPGSSPIPGTVVPPAQPAGTPPAGQAAAPLAAGTLPPAQVTTPPATPPAAPPAAAATTAATPPPPAQVLVTPSECQVGGAPCTVALSIANASHLSTLTLTLSFNPALVRVRAVQEGAFMRQGGAMVGFTQQVDAAAGRVDITLNRVADTTGAAGSGSVAAVLFDAVAPGSVTLTASGVASGPGSVRLSLQFSPATMTVR